MKICPKCGKEYGDTNTLCPSDGTVLERTDDALIGQTLADKYRVEELISAGGMGAVYRGTHVLMDKTVAIKVLHPALAADDKIVARFHREAKAASRISHPHALSVTDFGESGNGIVYLVMEYLHGRTLKEVIHEESPLPLPRVVEIMRQVSEALEAAHREGVVHRDLKSDNIMLVNLGGEKDWAKVLDFGIAKIQEPVGHDPALTAPNLIIGTPQYMSPEQCSQSSDIDSRSDIYSLGIILFEMLTGHVPFMGESPTAIMMKHLQDPVPSALDKRADVPVSVQKVIERAMAKQPEDRFPTTMAMWESLADAAQSEVLGDAAGAAGAVAGDKDTNRIIVPTDSHEAPRQTAESELDEVTVVRQRTATHTPAFATEEIRTEVAPPSSANFNLWKIVVPSVAAMLVVFAVVYAFTRGGDKPSANDQPTLKIDSNSQPVQPSKSPTGDSERGIASSLPTPAASPESNVNNSSRANQNSEMPSEANKNANRKEGANRNDNAAQDNTQNQDEPPNPAPSNSNKRGGQPTPTPAQDNNGDEPPPVPSPTPKKKATPTPPQEQGTPPPMSNPL